MDCDILPYEQKRVCKTYQALRNHPGWWSVGDWNGYNPGPLTPQGFLGLLLRMEFNNSAPGWNTLFASIQQETTVRNFYFKCSDFYGNTCNSRSTNDIFSFIVNKGLIANEREQMHVTEDEDSEKIAEQWKDNTVAYSKANFEYAFLNPGSWVSGKGEKKCAGGGWPCLYSHPMEWGNVSMLSTLGHPTKFAEAQALLSQNLDRAQGIREDRFFVAKGGRNAALLYTYSQWMYWFEQK
jgi:hypothetical protein